jgi:hypothetical protein
MHPLRNAAHSWRHDTTDDGKAFCDTPIQSTQLYGQLREGLLRAGLEQVDDNLRAMLRLVKSKMACVFVT